MRRRVPHQSSGPYGGPAADPAELGTVGSFVSNGHARLPVYLDGAE
jgi:hypothetical protein